MPLVHVKEDESFENAMRRFKRKCEKSGILSELKKRQHYEKPSAKRKRKMIQARKKMLRKLSEERRATLVDSADGGGADREALEFGVVLRLVSSLARTPPGRAAVLSLAPAHDESDVAPAPRRNGRGLRVPDPARPAAARPGSRTSRPRSTPSRARAAPARPEEFRPIVRAARASDAVRRALAKAESPHLSARREAPARPSTRCSPGPRGSSARTAISSDDASPELAAIRSRLRRRRGEVSRLLEKLLDDAARRPRRRRRRPAQRPLLPAGPGLGARAACPGIVHDRSGSGQTVFVEPLEVIESNNDLALLAAEERREVERLLAEFGRAILGAGRSAAPRPSSELAALDALEAKVGLRRDGRGAAAGDLGRRRLDARRARAIRCSTRASRSCAGASSARRARGPRRRAARPRAARRIAACSSSRAPTPAARPSC